MRQFLVPLLVGLACRAALPAAAADLPVPAVLSPIFETPFNGDGGGYRASSDPRRPASLRFDIYGYPLLPDPLAAGGGCPTAVQPNYDYDGNFAGYSPLPLCR